MRIAGGIILLVFGLWSLVGGGCSILGGGLMSKAGDLQAAAQEAAKEAGSNVKVTMTDEQKKALADAGSTGTGLFVSGIVSTIGGLLCIIAGIMFFVNKGKMLGFLAPGVGIIGEILFIVMVTFSIVGVIKILAYAFAAFAATKIGADQ